ncbi:terminase large subunit domain-containing protein [uncultured Corynebacterium sp.]|uniref:terminase large subunit domain-containing protein n=1 Tax=uncultured Corynebacterium sp. TaxID=159447 RepID=UPI0025E7FE47|nr:terminase family protein [uncultured Corynebacterium sp.]
MALLGVQKPRLSSIPEGDRERGDKAVAFVRWCGLTLYPWQEDFLRDLCLTNEKEMWAARNAIGVVARQNGKGEILVARELAGIYLFGEKTIFHSAHFMDTAIDAQKRLWEVIEDHDGLMSWWEDEGLGVPRKTTGNGKEAISFPNGAMIYFRTRTKKSGRGLSVELLILDECFDLPKETYNSLSKLTRAQENAQTIYISSPVNTEEHDHGAIFSAKRWAAIDGAPRTLFKEWSPDDDDDPFAQSTWAKCNPSLVDEGPGALLEDIEDEALGAKKSQVMLDSFKVETLAQGNWVPRDSDLVGAEPLVDLNEWGVSVGMVTRDDPDSTLGVGVTPDGVGAALVVAAFEGDVVILAVHPLTQFDRGVLVDAVCAATEANSSAPPLAAAMDPSGACSTLIQPLMKRGIYPEEMNGSQVSQSYELFMRLWAEGRVKHDGDPRWVDAWRVATERSRQGKYRALERFSGDVSILDAAMAAVWALQEFSEPEDVSVVQKKKFVGSARPAKKTNYAAVMQF